MIPSLSYNDLLNDNRLMRNLLQEWLKFYELNDFSLIPELTDKYLKETVNICNEIG